MKSSDKNLGRTLGGVLNLGGGISGAICAKPEMMQILQSRIQTSVRFGNLCSPCFTANGKDTYSAVKVAMNKLGRWC